MDLLKRALMLAVDLHGREQRKLRGTPTLSHLLTVGALVMEEGARSEVVAAAFLHDAVEDQGGQKALALIREHLGEEVAGLVMEVTETDEDPKPAWKLRKLGYLAHLEEASSEACLIALADKVANLEDLNRSLAEMGVEVIKRFNADVNEQRWFYRSCYEALTRRIEPGYLLSRLERSLDDFESHFPD